MFTNVIFLVIIITLLVFQRKIGKLLYRRLAGNLGHLGPLGASWLLHHSMRSRSLQGRSGLLIPPHAKIHFFMAAIYTLSAMAFILFITWTGLLHGRRSAWYAILGVFLVGGGAEPLAGRSIFQHGSPSMLPSGIPIRGSSWEYYIYLISWPSALAVSYRLIFAKRLKEPAQPDFCQISALAGRPG